MSEELNDMYSDDKIKREMGRACSTYVERCTQNFGGVT
jgi:hypothetical protein